jgi:hypothetical protein
MKPIKKYLELPHMETIISANTLQTKPFDNQKVETMSNNKQTTDYKYPVGDFLSGFSEDQNNPCDYELECQRMVIRGVQYLDEHPELFEHLLTKQTNAYDSRLEGMTNFMTEGEIGQTGAMVNHSVSHAYHAKKMGWDNYIETITEKDEQQ